MIVKLLTEHHLEFLSLKGGCTGSYESTLVKMPHCWKSHATAQLIKIANRNLGIIFRTFTYLGKEIFMNLFKSLGRPHLEYYASSVWSPIYKKDRIAIENVQRRATNLVTSVSHLPYGERLRNLGPSSLEYRKERERERELTKYKC